MNFPAMQEIWQRDSFVTDLCSEITSQPFGFVVSICIWMGVHCDEDISSNSYNDRWTRWELLIHGHIKSKNSHLSSNGILIVFSLHTNDDIVIN